MAGCGYVCPLCEGKGFIAYDKECTYCNGKEEELKQKEEDRNEWIKKVHEGPCCGDRDEDGS